MKKLLQSAGLACVLCLAILPLARAQTAIVKTGDGPQKSLTPTFETIRLDTIIQGASYWDASTSEYIAPKAGLYQIVSKIRLGDNAAPTGYGQGVGTATEGDPGMIWTNTTGSRNSLSNTRIAFFDKGARLRMFGYADRETPLFSAEMVVTFVETVKATPTPKPTATPRPTATVKPTATPKPTATVKPTATPLATATPKPLPTAIPIPTATTAPVIVPIPVPVDDPPIADNPDKGKPIKIGVANLAKLPYARNVWSMKLHEGKIYLGGGDSAANSGTTPIWALDTATGEIALEFITDDEQVDEFTPLDGTLYVTGHDSIFPAISKIYKKENDGWKTWATITLPAHLFSFTKFQGAYYAAGSDWQGNFDVWKSSDSGATWSGVADGKWKYKLGGQLTPDYTGARAYMLFELGGSLYAQRDFTNQDSTMEKRISLQKLNPASGLFENLDITGPILTPGLDKYYFLTRYKRWVALRDGSALTLAVESVNDQEWNPLALYHVQEFVPGGVSKVALPSAAIPYDLLARGAVTYVLGWLPTQQQIVVFALDESLTAKEILRFDSPTFARSFEEVNGVFYFGLGSGEKTVSPNTGEIWKVATR